MFIVLAVAWACALGPGIVRNLGQRGLSFRLPRRNRGRGDSSSFGFSAASVAGTLGNLRSRRRRPVATTAPRTRLSPAARRTRKRRRELLAGLSSVAFGSLLLGMVPGLRMLLVLSAVSMSLLALYVVALVRLKAGAQSGVLVPLHRESYQYAYNRASGE
jgi:hypothetical protein